MVKVAIITDSNSGMTQAEGKAAGIHILPMPFFIDEEMFFEDITLSQAEFYRRLKEDADISTSQPAPAEIMELWDGLLKEYDEVVHIPMSSGLSGSCETAMALAGEYDDRVQVVDNKRISITQRQSAYEALELAKQGKNAKEIKGILEAEALEASIYLGVDTLKYLKKGGRITPAAAAIGTVLNLKPVLQIQGEKLDAYAKVRGFKAAKKVMLDAVAGDVEKRFANTGINIMIAHSSEDEQAVAQWKEEVENRFPGLEVYVAPLSLSIVCHTGPGVLAVAAVKRII